ncbi:hypothetical protein L1049_022483 [Liquidambar formosana]|uniref:Uncharacterized protein n=1 Tax=Liquidambar formosana TaxID=63359 RepID=A0AAP0REC8_LIQFO
MARSTTKDAQALFHTLRSALSSYSSEQRKQGIQGPSTRARFCRLRSLQFSAPFGDYEFPGLNGALNIVGMLFPWILIVRHSIDVAI